MEQLKALIHDPRAQAAAAFGLIWLLAAWRAFKNEFNASQWTIKPERHKALHALAYAGALPVRLIFAAFTGFVEALVWALIAGFVYAMWHVWRG